MPVALYVDLESDTGSHPGHGPTAGQNRFINPENAAGRDALHVAQVPAEYPHTRTTAHRVAGHVLFPFPAPLFPVALFLECR